MKEELACLFDKIKEEMRNQTEDIMAKMAEKLNPIIKEISNLKLENKNLHEKIDHMEREKRKNNIIAFGIKEEEKSKWELLETVTNIIKNQTNVAINSNDINAVYRLGKKDKESEKPRPVSISFINLWKKEMVMKNKKKMGDIYITEDYPKKVIQQRKALQQQLAEERSKGNYAIIKYNQLIVRNKDQKNDKRKHDKLDSPNGNTAIQQNVKTAKLNRSNAFDAVRNRSNSFHEA